MDNLHFTTAPMNAIMVTPLSSPIFTLMKEQAGTITHFAISQFYDSP
ncbi:MULTISPECIES: hypothetical protein [unclassified Bartonella]